MFFTPWPASRMEKHPKDMGSEEVVLEGMDETLIEGNEMMREMGCWETWMWGQSMCYRLMWEVEVAPRKRENCKPLPLKWITQWRFVQ